MIITSTSNTHIKNIRKLREKKAREETGLFYVEGLRIVIEAFQQHANIDQLIYCPELLVSENGQQIVNEAIQRGVEIIQASKDVFSSLALKDRPQGIAAVIQQKIFNLEDIPSTGAGIWTALDSIADPGNLGTVMRTMDAVGGKGVILIDNCTDPYDPTTTRASMGALFSMKLVQTRSEDFIRWKKEIGMPVVGTSDKATSEYREVIYPRDMLLLMGSERQGMQENLSNICDQVVRIPMVGISDSLNLSIANAVVLYEIFHQHRNDQEKGLR